VLALFVCLSLPKIIDVPAVFPLVESTDNVPPKSSFFSKFSKGGKLCAGVQIGPPVFVDGWSNPTHLDGKEMTAYRDEEGKLRVDKPGKPIFITDDEMAGLAASVQKQGFTFVRTDLLWAVADYLPVENRDFATARYDFDGYVRFAEKMAERGIGVLFTFRGANNKYRVSDREAKSFVPTQGAKFYDLVSDIQIRQFANFARGASRALRLASQRNPKMQVAFEIGNETNTKPFFNDGYPENGIDDPRAGSGYARVTQTTLGALKSEWEQAPVVSGGTFTTPPNFLREILKKKDAQAQSGKWFSLDGLGVHPYSRVEPEAMSGFTDKTGRTMYDPMGSTRALAKGDPTTKDLTVPPVCVTEVGYTSTLFKADGNGDKTNANFDGSTAVSWHRQAVYALRAQLVLWAKATSMISLYEFEDRSFAGTTGKWIFDIREEQAHYGMMDFDSKAVWPNNRAKPSGKGKEKSAAVAFRALNRFAGDVHQGVSFHHDLKADHDLYALRLGDKRTIIWLRNPKVEQECQVGLTKHQLFVPGVTTASDMYGRKVTAITTRRSGLSGVTIELCENDGPVYLR
jgi:hypothetical protein